MDHPNLSPATPALQGPQHSLQSKLDRLNYYRQEDRHEWTLLSNRLSSYITSQAFLITAYAISMGNANEAWNGVFTLCFPLLLSVIGLLTSMLAYPGISGAREIIDRWHRKQDELLKDPELADYRDDRPRTRGRTDQDEPIDHIHRRSLWFAGMCPVLFVVVWVVLAGFSIYLASLPDRPPAS